MDADTGLYYFTARWYDAELGRFVTEDPARDGTNWYEYCLNNPLNYTDPLGLEVTYDMHGRHDSGAEAGSSEGPGESKGGKGRSEAGTLSDGKNEIEIKQGTFKDPWPAWAKRFDQGLSKFLARNFFGIRPDGYVRTVEGTIIPMSESGTSFAYSERVRDAGFFLVTAFAGAFDLTKTSALTVAVQLESGTAEVAGNEAKAVRPGETGTYGGLKAQKKLYGETEALDMDHQPSFAAQVFALENKIGRTLTPTERATLKESTPVVASPRAVHRQTSPTYGGRNNPSLVAEDAANLDAAAARDRAVFDEAMRNR